MSVMSTVLVFVVIPAVIMLGVGALTLAGGDRSRPDRRYRPGRPFEFAPIWFLAAPEQVSSVRSGEHVHGKGELTGGSAAVESSAGALVIEDASGKPRLPGPVGGASDRW